MQEGDHGLSTDPVSWETHDLELGFSYCNWNTHKISHKNLVTWKKEEKKRQYKGSVE